MKRKKLTPVDVWNKYVHIEPHIKRPVEYFLSNFREDGITDINRMCRIFARETVEINDGLATTEYIQLVAKLLEQYINDYIDSQGGRDKLKLYTHQEMNKFGEDSIKEILDLIKR